MIADSLGPAGSSLPTRILWRLPRNRRNTRIDGFHNLNHDLRLPIQCLHHPIHDPRHVVEIDVEISLRQHTDDAELDLLDSDIDAHGGLNQVIAFAFSAI